MSRPRRHELAGAGSASSWPAAAWIQPMVAAGSLLALLLASGARAGEVSATQGPLDLGTRVNGVAGGRCQGGQCEVSGGTSAGANLFHRFNRFDTRGEIRGVSIQNGSHSTVVLGVLDPLGSFLNKGISLSSPAHLFFLSPGGLHVGGGAQFFNTPRLTLSTASSLGLGSGRFEVFRTTASEAALLTGVPIRGKGGLSGDPAEAQSNGITSGGDLVVDGGLIQVDAELLLDAQGGHLLLQAGSQLAVPGGSVELNGKNVTVAAGALVTTSAQAPAAPAPGTTTAPAVAPVVPAPAPAPAAVATTAASPAAPALAAVAEAAVATSAATPATPALATAAANPSPTTVPAQTPAAPVEAPAATATTATTATSAAPEPATPVLTAAAANPASATPQTSALQVPAAVAGPLPETNPPAPVQIPAGLDGGVIRISASNDALVAGQLKALGVAATASGTAASGQAGRGGRIEITGQRVALTGAVLDASGPAGGGTVLLGGDVRGANPALPNASSTTVDGASTVRADALAQGDGGTVVLWSEQQTSFAGTTSARGGPSGGDGGFLEVSSKGGVGFSGAVDAAAPAGKAGSVLFDPNNIIIDSSLQFNGDAYWDSAKGSVVLTPSAVNKSGSFFYDTAISLADDASFSTSFQFKISESKGHDGQDGADGLVFVIKNSNAKAIGDNGEGLGYKGISNSLGIEFDTYNNGIVAEAYKDSDGNHVGINLNGSIESKEATKIASNFNNALPWTAWVDYNDNLRSVDVRLANNSNSRPDSSVLSYILQKSLKDTIGEVNGSSLASFGFTAATGGATGKHEILSWSLFTPSSGSFSLNPSGDLLLQPAQIQTIANQGTNVVLQANNDITLKPNSSITIQSPTAGSGGISMQAGRSITLQSPITYVGEYSGPVNLIANDSSSFSNFRDIGAGNLTVDTGANLTSPHALVSLILGPGNNVYSPGVLQVKAPITASSVLARGASGISLSGGATLTASASSGKALTLDAGSGAFLNTSSAGAAALVKQPGATWAIYADNPTSTPPANLGGLPYNFKQYNQTFDTNQGSNPILGAGNGLFFANSPTLSVNLVPTPQVSKVYDGTNTANLVDSNYAVTGVSPGDSVNINKPTSGIYDNKNAAIGKLVSVSGLSIASATDATTAVPVYGYILGNSTANASIGTITKASAVVTANSGSTVYDSTLKSISGFSASGLVGGETIVDLPGVSAGASGRNAGSYTSTASGTAQNYSLSFVDGLFSITKAPLTISAATDSRVYNGTTSSSAAPTVTSGQVFSGDTLSGLSQVFDSKNVLGTNQSTLKVSVGYTLSDGNNGNNYAVSLATAPGTITPLPLPVTGLVANNKVYDATTVALLGGSAAVSPFSGDEVSVGVTAVGAFSDKNVGVDKEVTVTGVTISGADSGNYNLLQQSGLKADIFKANLAVSGLVANNKVYDATTVAPLGGSAAVRPLSGDEVSVGGTAVGAFAEKNVGGGNAVTVSGVTIAGRDAANYNLLQQTGLAATISKRDLMVAGLFANNKVYDATTVAPLGGSAAVSPFSGDVVTLGGTAAAAFSDKNVGMDKAVTVSGVTIAGRDAGNYNLLQQIGLKADISRAALSLTGLLALDKVYDATTVAPLGGSAAVSPLSGDVVTLGGTAVGSFADKNVAQAKTVSVSGLSLSGNDAGNYNLLPLTNLKAAITPATLQISASSDSKIYDGSTQSSLAPKITQGSLWGDDRLTGLAQTYESKNALGAGQSKLIVSAYTLTDGNNGGNYVLSFLPGLGTINRASVTPSFTVKSKPYDGNVAAEIAGNSLQGGLASDELFMVGASALFDNASAGNDKLVTITGYTLSGQDANNYQLSSPTATSTASITTQQDTDSSLPNDEPIKNEKANPTVGLQLSTISSATASKSVDVDSSNIMALPPGASTLESTPSGSTESQPTPSATAVSATSSVPNQTQPTASATASATAVTAGSATQEYQESDNRSAEDAKTSLGLSNAPTSEAMSAARLQLVMQSAASYIRKYPVRMLNQ